MPKVEITHPDKLLFPKDKITKAEVIAYYQSVSEFMLPLIKDRPLTLQRFPHGIEDPLSFYQKNVPDYYPDWIDRIAIPNRTADGGTTTYVLCDNESTLTYLVNTGAITLHAWLSKKQAIDYPDRLIIDLDPSKKGFAAIKKVAFDLKAVFESLELSPFVMTTGSRGLHVVAPLDAKATFDEVRLFARMLMQWYNQQNPEATTLEMHLNERKGRIFLDYLRNAYGQTGVAPYCLRPHPGAPVAAPLHWHELEHDKLSSQTFNLKNIGIRLQHIENPWKDINRFKGSIKRAEELFQKMMIQ